MNKKQTKSFRSILRVLERELGFQSDSESQCCGMTLTQCHVLMELVGKKTANIKELSELFGLDKSSLSRIVDKMFESGYLIRTEKKDDRRFLSISLTEKGVRTAEEINAVCDRYFGKLFKLIPEDKHSSVIESLILLTNAMNGLRKDTFSGSDKCCSIK
jgi:DNA-binding MarR family transcriptional regulator